MKMKIKSDNWRITSAFLLVITLVALIVFSCATAFAQANTVPTNPGIGADAAASALGALIGALTAKYGWLVTVIAWIGVLRTAFKPLMLFVEAVVKATPGTADDAAVDNFERGPVYKWLVWGLDWIASIKSPTAATTNPLVKQ